MASDDGFYDGWEEDDGREDSLRLWLSVEPQKSLLEGCLSPPYAFSLKGRCYMERHVETMLQDCMRMSLHECKRECTKRLSWLRFYEEFGNPVDPWKPLTAHLLLSRLPKHEEDQLMDQHLAERMKIKDRRIAAMERSAQRCKDKMQQKDEVVARLEVQVQKQSEEIADLETRHHRELMDFRVQLEGQNLLLDLQPALPEVQKFLTSLPDMYCNPEYLGQRIRVPIQALRWCQTFVDIHMRFTDKRKIVRLVEELMLGEVSPEELTDKKPLNIFVDYAPDDSLGAFSMDNRRLIAFRMFQATKNDEARYVHCIVWNDLPEWKKAANSPTTGLSIRPGNREDPTVVRQHRMTHNQRRRKNQGNRTLCADKGSQGSQQAMGSGKPCQFFKQGRCNRNPCRFKHMWADYDSASDP